MSVNSPVNYDETWSLIQTTLNSVYQKVEADFLVGGKVIPSIKVINYDELCDFEGSTYPETTIEVMLFDNVFQNDIFPFRNELKIQIRRYPMDEKSDSSTDIPPQVETLRVIPMTNQDMEMQGIRNFDSTMSASKYTFTLMPTVIEHLRLMTTGGIFLRSTPADILRVLLGKNSSKPALPVPERVSGVDMVDGEMKTQLDTVIVPHGTPVLELAGYIQKECGGIYNYGIGCFLKNKHWFVYPLYKTQRYESAERAVDIIIIPPSLSKGNDRTWRYEAGRLTIASTGDMSQIDDTDVKKLVLGNGVRFIKAKDSHKFVDVSKNVATADVNVNTAQFITSERQVPLQSVPFASRRITDNTAAQISNLTSREGQLIQLMWDASNPTLLEPGMPVRIFYKVAGGVKGVTGILLGIQSNTSPVSKDSKSVRQVTSSYLSLYVERVK